MVCGKREIDIDYLKANTRYRLPVRPTDAHVQVPACSPAGDTRAQQTCRADAVACA
jgi:hypothetical protein